MTQDIVLAALRSINPMPTLPAGKTEAEKGFEKDAIIQSLTKEEIEKSPIFTEAIAQKLKESGQTIEVIKAVTGSGNIKLSPEGAVSNSQKIRQFLA